VQLKNGVNIDAVFSYLNNINGTNTNSNNYIHKMIVVLKMLVSAE